MISRISLPWRWFGGLALLLAVLLVAVNLALRLTLPDFLRQRVDDQLRRHVLLAEPAFRPLLAASDARINDLARDLGRRTGLRVTVMNAEGLVLAESGMAPALVPQIEPHLNRPEIQQSLRGPVGYDTRVSATINRPLRYAAVAVREGDRLLGFVRVALPLREIDDTVARVERTIAGASLLVGLLALPVLYAVARRVTGPIAAMEQMAAAVAAGDCTRRAPVAGGPELEQLGAALNDMAAQLAARLRELHDETAELTAVLASMTEGVMVVDADGKIKLMNAALRQQFQLTDDALGQTPLAALRHLGLAELLAHPASRELTFQMPTERTFAVTATALSGRAGLVVVFHDITRLKRLENLRQEFVANVSHELRTPLSIIKGYVETLLDDPPPDAATAKQFLETVQRHARRLEALIADLLTISELESQQTRLQLAPVSLAKIAQAAVQELALRAREKHTTVAVEIPADLPAVTADAQRLHQVLVNLLDNAIKYTPAGSRVAVSAQTTGGAVEVCVADNGPGIAAEDLPRIFERFYRVDKARSRELGGTGLGLSIVKHIVQTHGGRVWAESEVGRGSQFYFTLPAVTA